MINTLKYFVLTLLLTPLLLLAQRPDFAMDKLFEVSQQNNRTIEPIQANTSLYCNGESITLVVQVFDDRINLDPSPLYTDHIELWFALPATSYPTNFEYGHHAAYVYYPDYSRDQPSPRFFSIYPEYAPQLRVDDFVDKFDYPSERDVLQDRLSVPVGRNLEAREVHYGIVQYGIYPNQPPQLLNRDHHAVLERSLGQGLGDLASQLNYSVEMDRGSYTVNVEITPEVLGFVSLPELAEMRFMVNIMDTGSGGKARRVLSSSQNGEAGRPSSFNEVRFFQPLRTNMTDVPDGLFRVTGFHPVMINGERGWIPTSVDTDALVYKEQTASQSLVEVKFSEQPFRYSNINQQGISLHRLEVLHDFVNSIAEEREYMMLNGQLFAASRMRNSISPLDTLNSSFFRFPDGSPGLLVKENTPMDPYGWGKNGHLIEETIRIHRVVDDRTQDILYIQQGEGERPYCFIQGQDFSSHYVSKLDWIRKGEILVLILTDWNTGYPTRVKISWNPDGTNVQVEKVD